jgi:hypothetical protein
MDQLHSGKVLVEDAVEKAGNGSASFPANHLLVS